MPMPIARITGQGLTAIAFSVGLLWSCVIVQRVEHRTAVTERARIVREVRQMQRQHRSEPASTPSPYSRKRSPVTVG
jgi:hypothetical protein